VVGRGPWDQSSRQTPRARAAEVLPRPAPLRFERARGGSGEGGGWPRFLLDYGLKPFLGGVLALLGECDSNAPPSTEFLNQNIQNVILKIKIPPKYFLK
jgi:hypothetical protein